MVNGPRPMTAANSDDTESFHNWSANSRWLVVSSRRDDGLFTRPYFCHVDADGRVSKAFMLPQRNPRQFYRDRFLSFNVPEFIIAPRASTAAMPHASSTPPPVHPSPYVSKATLS